MSVRIKPLCTSLMVLVTIVITPFAYALQLPDFTDLIGKVSPAVVNISTTQKVSAGLQLPEGIEIPELPEGSPFGELYKHFFGQQGRGGGQIEREATSLGSGFIISADGYVITNNHVVKDADEIMVRLTDRRELKAKVIGTDPRSDIALLKIEADHLPVAEIGQSEKLEVGEWVLAIGSPFGFERSATAGIVSAKGRALPKENYVPFIQTDVAINPGNSGGPLFDLEGKVVGVNSQIYSRSGGYMGLSFSIPIDVAMDVVEQLKQKGKVSRGWLGVLIQDVTRELAESFSMKTPQGALIAKILPDSPASKSGFKVGDVVVSFNGKDIERSSSLPPVVGSTPVGKEVPVSVMRDGKLTKFTIKLGELPEEGAVMAKASDSKALTNNRLGVDVANLSDEQKSELELDNGGVLIEQVGEGAASDAGFHQGDVILRIDNKPVDSVKTFDKVVDKLPAGKSVAVLIQRRGGPVFLALKTPE
ncbi:MAG: DegQ family serine endoprotease [Gammaproteobacteria bacterium]